MARECTLTQTGDRWVYDCGGSRYVPHGAVEWIMACLMGLVIIGEIAILVWLAREIVRSYRGQ
jgi:hypothetical protein